METKIQTELQRLENYTYATRIGYKNSKDKKTLSRDLAYIKTVTEDLEKLLEEEGD